jgi:hypothetical protein
MEPLSLAIGTFHCFNPCEVNLISHSAFRAVCKRRGFYKGARNPEFAAVNAEPTVFERLFFFREALHSPLYYRNNPIIFIHCQQILSSYFHFPPNYTNHNLNVSKNPHD